MMKRRSGWKVFSAAGGAAAFFALLLTMTTGAAGKGCNRPQIAQTWINPKANLNEISKLDIHYNCGEKPIKAYDPLSASLWIVKAYVRCARTDCTWGRAKGNTYKDGSIVSTFSTFSALRTVTMLDEGGLLKVSVVNKFRDPKRPTENFQYYLHPEQ